MSSTRSIVVLIVVFALVYVPHFFQNNLERSVDHAYEEKTEPIISPSITPMESNTNSDDVTQAQPTLAPDEGLQLIEENVLFELNTPKQVLDMTIKVVGFDHKFQDSADEAYEWVTVEIATGTDPQKETSFGHSRFIDSTDGLPKEFYGEVEVGQNVLKMTQMNYGYSILVDVYKKNEL